MQPGYKFALGQVVRVSDKETGTVIARAEYLHNHEYNYLLRYVAGDGRAVESWWWESALTAF